MKIINYLMLLSLFTVLISCNDEADTKGKEIYFKADKSAFNVQTASFTFYKANTDTSAGSSDLQEKRFWVKRDPSDTLGAKIRAEGADGSVMTYNGEHYMMKDTINKKVIVPDSSTEAFKLASIYYSIYSVVMKSFSDSIGIAQNNTIELIGNDMVDGEDCYIITFRKKGEEYDVRSYVYISTKDYFIRKILSEMIIDEEVKGEYLFIVKNLQTDIELDDSLFYQEAPEGYKVEVFSLQ